MQRRNFLTGGGAFLAAPAIVRTPGLLMPIKPLAFLSGTSAYYAGATVMPWPPYERWEGSTLYVRVDNNVMLPAEAQCVRNEMRRLALNALNHQVRPNKMNYIL